MKRILITGEASFLATGYGTITYNLCSRLHALGFQVAEFSNYGDPHFNQRNQIPWTYYGNLPLDHQKDAYNGNMSWQWGSWRFEDVCLHFQPDLVVSFLDHWMSAHILDSPYKKCFKFLWVPTVDAEPQNEQWIADYSKVDYLGTYTNWAKSLLEKQGDLHPIVLSPGVDYNKFIPVTNKAEHKKKAGLPEDAFIVGTVMRNQKRKLYPDLCISFKKLLDKLKKEGKDTSKVFLYLHTAYPDLGWDIARLIKENELCANVLTTYTCTNCLNSFVSFFNDAVYPCLNCNGAAKTPSVQNGVKVEILNEIYNLFDVYVQWANSEGFGIPVVEAASAGVPVIVMDYSGMSDFKDTVGAIPIAPIALSRESETHCNRAIADNDKLVEEIISLYNLSIFERSKLGFATRRKCIANYKWESTVKNIVDILNTKECASNWNHPIHMAPMNINIPNNISNKDFIDLSIINILGRYDLINSYWAANLLKNLNTGYYTYQGDSYICEDSMLFDRLKMQPCTKESIIQNIIGMAQKNNHWESIRGGLIPYEIPEWIQISTAK